MCTLSGVQFSVISSFFRDLLLSLRRLHRNRGSLVVVEFWCFLWLESSKNFSVASLVKPNHVVHLYSTVITPKRNAYIASPDHVFRKNKNRQKWLESEKEFQVSQQPFCEQTFPWRPPLLQSDIIAKLLTVNASPNNIKNQIKPLKEIDL